MTNENSYILWENRQVVAIATGFTKPSANPKTGPLVQIWFIRKDRHPSESINDGSDKAQCFNCPLRKQKDSGRGCYVRMDPVASIWKKYTRGGYRKLQEGELEQVFAGKFVRFGAYGEPILLPFPMVQAIAQASAGWTGYTHQWRNPLFQAYRAYFMASTDASDYQEAQTAGWRTFTVSAQPLERQMTCPASKEFEAVRGYRLTCADCRQCAGTSKSGRSIVIAPHGNGAKYAN